MPLAPRFGLAGGICSSASSGRRCGLCRRNIMNTRSSGQVNVSAPLSVGKTTMVLFASPMSFSAFMSAPTASRPRRRRATDERDEIVAFSIDQTASQGARCTAASARPGNDTAETDCVAGVRGLELANVVSKRDRLHVGRTAWLSRTFWDQRFFAGKLRTT